MVRLKTKAEIKEDLGINWIGNHRVAFILYVISAITSILIIPFVLVGGYLATLEIEMLKAIVQVESTIIGFFGAIFIYAITSLDKRIDERQKQIIDIKINSPVNSNLVDVLDSEIRNIRITKKTLVYSSILAGIVFTLSLISSITALGFRNIIPDWAYILSSISILFLIFGLIQTLLIVYDLKNSPEKQTED